MSYILAKMLAHLWDGRYWDGWLWDMAVMRDMTGKKYMVIMWEMTNKWDTANKSDS